jgi:DNA-binding LacI/PurR family transcriptional regulator
VTRFVAAGHVDGALLVSARAGDPIMDELMASGVPLGAIGVPLGRESSMAYVSVDDRQGARQMMSHLKSLGRSRIATVTGPLDTPGGRLARPALTTIRQPWPQISSEMVRLLLSLAGGEPRAAVILPTELVVRDSA